MEVKLATLIGCGVSITRKESINLEDTPKKESVRFENILEKK